LFGTDERRVDKRKDDAKRREKQSVRNGGDMEGVSL
jgi:hypothetical protein